MSKRMTIQEIQNFIKEYDIEKECSLLSTEYVNRNTPLLLKCNICGENFERDYAHLQRKRFCCQKCAKSKVGKKLSFSINNVLEYLKENNCSCSLISTEYKNAITPLEFKCECGNTFFRDFDHLKRGAWRCESCYRNSFIKKAYDSNEGEGTLLTVAVRSSTTTKWRNKCLEQSNYQCDISKNSACELVVHHLNYNFSDIVDEALNILQYPKYKYVNQYSKEEYSNILRLIREMHENIEGVVLDKKYHILFHSIYGHQNNTKEQYLEFKNKILNNKN